MEGIRNPLLRKLKKPLDILLAICYIEVETLKPKGDSMSDELERMFAKVKKDFIERLTQDDLSIRDCNERSGLKVQIIAEQVTRTVTFTTNPGPDPVSVEITEIA